MGSGVRASFVFDISPVLPSFSQILHRAGSAAAGTESLRGHGEGGCSVLTTGTGALYQPALQQEVRVCGGGGGGCSQRECEGTTVSGMHEGRMG